MRTIALAILLAACSGKPHARSFVPAADTHLADSKLTKAEQRLVDSNGFAILARGETSSFHGGYTALFEEHQPVYVTADSILYAWHSSYDEILQAIETEHLIPTARAMLGELRKRLRDSKALPETRADVDAYLAIAMSFLDGKSRRRSREVMPA
jgi:hypothetical protein